MSAKPLTPEEERALRLYAEAVVSVAPSDALVRQVELPLVRLFATLDAARARAERAERECGAAAHLLHDDGQPQSNPHEGWQDAYSDARRLRAASEKEGER